MRFSKSNALNILYKLWWLIFLKTLVFMEGKRYVFGKNFVTSQCNPEEWDLPRNMFNLIP